MDTWKIYFLVEKAEETLCFYSDVFMLLLQSFLNPSAIQLTNDDDSFLNSFCCCCCHTWKCFLNIICHTCVWRISRRRSRRQQKLFFILRFWFFLIIFSFFSFSFHLYTGTWFDSSSSIFFSTTTTTTTTNDDMLSHHRLFFWLNFLCFLSLSLSLSGSRQTPGVGRYLCCAPFLFYLRFVFSECEFYLILKSSSFYVKNWKEKRKVFYSFLHTHEIQNQKKEKRNLKKFS